MQKDLFDISVWGFKNFDSGGFNKPQVKGQPEERMKLKLTV